MKRRDLLRMAGAGVVAPYNTVTSEGGDLEKPPIGERLVSTLDDTVDETGRLYRAYHLGHSTEMYEKWVMETQDGDVLYQDHYPADKLETYWDGIQLHLTYYSTASRDEKRGETFFSLVDDHVYHTHYRDDREDIQYREHIDNDDYERIQ